MAVVAHNAGFLLSHGSDMSCLNQSKDIFQIVRDYRHVSLVYFTRLCVGVVVQIMLIDIIDLYSAEERTT